jgi:hypothetical protein
LGRSFSKQACPEPQVEGRDHHADPVARQEQEDVLLEQGQAGGEHVALAEPARQQLGREGVDRGVE